MAPLNNKYTSGPWEAYHSVGAGWSVRKQHERPGYTGLAPICSMSWWQFDIPDIIDDKISEANARLIASAPDLLETLEQALKWTGFKSAFGNEEYYDEPMPPWAQKARIIISNLKE